MNKVFPKTKILLIGLDINSPSDILTLFNILFFKIDFFV